MLVDAWPGSRIHTKYKMNDIIIENLCDVDELENPMQLKLEKFNDPVGVSIPSIRWMI